MKKGLFAALLCCFGIAGCFSESERLELPEEAVLLDVRSQEEYASGHLKNAVCIPHDEIAEKISEAVPSKKTPLYIYCRSGRRVKIAIKVLRELGYNNLYDLGGYEEAKQALEIHSMK